MLNLSRSTYPRILFININPRPEWTRDKTLIYFNIGLCQVMTHVKKSGYDFDLLDFSVTPISQNDFIAYLSHGHYDLVAFGGMVHTLWQIEKIANMVKSVNPETCIAVGGYATMLENDAVLRWTCADVAIRGEGEFALVELLERMKQDKNFDGIPGIAYKDQNGIHSATIRKPDVPLDQKGFPDWDLFDIESYIESGHKLVSHHLGALRNQRFFPIITTRGCPFQCTFCSNNQLIQAHNPYRRHTPSFVAKMIKELHARYAINHFKFLDELSFLNKSDIVQLLDELDHMKLDVTFEAVCRVGLFGEHDLALAKRMKKAGFTRLFYSLESGSPKILKLMNKQISVEAFYTQKRVLDAAGISSGTNVIVGYPTETEEDIAQTFKVCLENSIMPSVCFLLPIPGSEMYDRALREGFIQNEKKYIFEIGEQQYLKINMTDITDEQLYSLALNHLKQIRDALKLDIPDEKLICSVNIGDKPEAIKTLFLS
ncbi:MAG: B12-binding domain-containing radical SAM protein [Desulfuromonadaceae bacterium]